jgi:hypothetical protein
MSTVLCSAWFCHLQGRHVLEGCVLLQGLRVESMQRHHCLVTEPQAHHLLVLATVAKCERHLPVHLDIVLVTYII